MKKVYLIIGVISAVLLIAILVFRQPRVELTHPFRGPAIQAVYATGIVEPSVMLPLAPRLGARLVELLVDEGEEVTKGQILARLESDEAKAKLEQLVAIEAFTRAEYERQARLLQRNATPQSVYERARSEFKSAIAAISEAQAQLGYLTITAPGDGLVIRRDGEIGELIPAQQPIFWFSSDGPLRITAEVDEEDIALLEVGQKTLISTDAFPNDVFNGFVHSITPKGDPIARSYRVRISFSEPTRLLVGMTTEVNIITRETQGALLLPTTTLDSDAVWIVEDGRLKQQAVSIGVYGTEYIEILDGLTEDSSVVLNPFLRNLRPGARVRTVLVQE